MNLLQNVKKNIQSHNLLSCGDKLIVAVSGGPDSVTLLYILNRLRYELGIELYIAHVNHKLRKSADTDRRFVEKLAQKLQLPCTVITLNPRRFSKGGSIEETARQLRFESLIKLAKQKKADAIALGHTQDDLAETVLMRILRGTGLLGMQGILPKRKIYGFYFIRPLLSLQRRQIEKYLKKEKILFRVDPSNKNTKFYRNKVRHKLLPTLEKEYSRNIRELLGNLANNAGLDYDFLTKEAEKSFQKISLKPVNAKTVRFKQARLLKLHPSLQRILVRQAIERLKGNTNRLTLRHIQEIEDLLTNRPVNSIVHLPDNITVAKKQENLVFSIKKPLLKSLNPL